jgi:hypothetical protein
MKKGMMNAFEEFVDTESRPLVSEDMTKHEIEFLAIANAFGGKVGELQDAVKKILRNDLYFANDQEGVARWQDFVLEAGDVLYYLARLLHHTEYTLEDAIQANINKLEARKLANETQTCQFTVHSSPFEL